ncbi:MAG: hypothetical protein AABN95_25815 [Acidobacteriota bacterium]
MKQRNLILVLIFALIATIYGWWIFASGEWFYTHGLNASNRAALLKIREKISVGDGYEQVLKIYWQDASPDLRLNSGSPKVWSISMPWEVGAGDWVLYLDFSDDKVSAIKVRTSDGPRPGKAPDDLGG